MNDISATELGVQLSDDAIGAFIDDPATIPTHEIALEVLDVLEHEIADIQAQVDAATIEAQAVPLSAEKQDWLRRACYAGAMRRNDRHRVMQRDKELRGTKSSGGKAKDPDKVKANLAKQERLLEETKLRRINKEIERSKQTAAQMRLAQERRELHALQSYQNRFVESAKRLLPTDTYEAIRASATGENLVREVA